MQFKISEIFYSLQGEGFLAGTPSLFIRLAGCPLRCRWCDTKYAWEPSAGELSSLDEILKAVQQIKARFIVITGGEPMLESQLGQLVQVLKKSGCHTTIETAGINFVPNLACDLMSISPKLSNSTPADPKFAAAHENLRLNIKALRQLISDYDYQLKFVVNSQDDLPEINHTLKKIGVSDKSKIMLMPQSKTRQELLAKSPMVAEFCKDTGFTFCNRLQILLWNNQRGC
jgi:7-carboxy-7-deazaguanine synthase